jgi:hypothetical protein
MFWSSFEESQQETQDYFYLPGKYPELVLFFRQTNDSLHCQIATHDMPYSPSTDHCKVIHPWLFNPWLLLLRQ